MEQQGVTNHTSKRKRQKYTQKELQKAQDSPALQSSGFLCAHPFNSCFWLLKTHQWNATWHRRFYYSSNAHTPTHTEFHTPLSCWTAGSHSRGSQSKWNPQKGAGQNAAHLFPQERFPVHTNTTLSLLNHSPCLLSSAGQQSRAFMAQTVP